MQNTETTTTALDDHYDVVIVGARAAGAATAMQLAGNGVKVLAIDKSTYGADTLSTHSIAPAGILLLSRWGVLDPVRAAGTPRADRVVFHYGDDITSIDITPRGDVDGLYSPRRTVLDRLLVDATIDAGATVRHGTTVSGVVRDERGRVNGVEIDDGGTFRTITAGFVIGADGMRSRVAERVGAPFLREERGASGVVYAYFHGLPDDVIVNDLRPGRAIGVIPTNDGEACVWVAVPSDRFRDTVADGVETAFDAAIETSPSLREQMAATTRVSRFRSFPGRAGFLRQAWGSGWALVGDSAYFKDPVSAHGITDALIGAELLADALTATIVNGADEREALACYQRQRDHLAAPMMPAVAKVAAFDWDPATVAGAYRDMNGALRHEWGFLESRFALATAA